MLQVPTFTFHGMGFLSDVSCKEGQWYAQIKVITYFDADQKPCCDNVLLNCSVNRTEVQVLLRQFWSPIDDPQRFLVDFDIACGEVEACFPGITAEDPDLMIHVKGELLAINSLSIVNCCPEELSVYLPVPPNDSIRLKIKALGTEQK